MKRENIYSMVTIMGILIAMFLTGCGGSSGGGGAVVNGSATGLADGSFNKKIVYNSAFSDTQFSTISSIRYHHLYQADDIQGSGNITALRFQYEVDLSSEVTCNNTTIKLGHTDVTDLTTTFADAIETGKGSFVTVIDNETVTIPVGTESNFFEIPLTKSFNYNGVDNLLVEISRTSGCSDIVSLYAGTETYGATVYSTVSAAEATGTASTSNTTIGFQFTGGDNEQNFGGLLNNSWPFSTSLPKVQTLYMADEIEGSGPVTGIAFQMNDLSVQNDVTYTAKLGHTTFTALTSIFADNFNSGSPVTVANAVDFTIPAGIPAGDYFWLPIPDGVFTYNGTDNLIVEVDVSSATDLTNLRRSTLSAGRRASGGSGTAVATGIDSTTYHIKLRFNGAPVQIMPVGNGAPSQVLGGFAGTGAGQMQSLYKPNFVGTGGLINSINLRLKTDSVAATITDYKIYMGGTAKDTLDVVDSYSSNMELNSTLVYDGSFDIPAGLKAGDWLNIPLQTGFTYDPTENMSILFMAASASPGDNAVSASSNAALFPTHSVGRNDNAVDIAGFPGWDEDGLVDIQLNISR